MHPATEAAALRRCIVRTRWPLLLAIPVILCAHRGLAQGQCEASEHGMRADGSDNIAALTRTLSECAGRTIHIAQGTYTFKPQGFAVGLTVPANTRIVGDGSQGERQTVLQIADTGNFVAFLWIRNVSNVSLQHLRFEGTSYESGCTKIDYGHAVWIWSDPGPGPAMNGIDISDNFFHDFNGQSWISVYAKDGSPGIGVNGKITISGNVFISDANLRGGCAATGGIGYPVHMISLRGSDLSAQGLVANVSVASDTFEAGYVKGAVAIWSGTQRISVADDTIRDAGLNLPVTPNTELGRYAILIYNSAYVGARELPGLHPDTISIKGNVITNPYSCGVYVAKGQNIEITGNRISGQRDRYDVTLPKGAIALNHADNVRALNNELTDNYLAISAAGTKVSAEGNRIVVPPGGVRAKIVP
jgi:hypothetical protein